MSRFHKTLSLIALLAIFVSFVLVAPVKADGPTNPLCPVGVDLETCAKAVNGHVARRHPELATAFKTVMAKIANAATAGEAGIDLVNKSAAPTKVVYGLKIGSIRCIVIVGQGILPTFFDVTGQRARDFFAKDKGGKRIPPQAKLSQDLREFARVVSEHHPANLHAQNPAQQDATWNEYARIETSLYKQFASYEENLQPGGFQAGPSDEKWVLELPAANDEMAKSNAPLTNKVKPEANQQMENVPPQINQSLGDGMPSKQNGSSGIILIAAAFGLFLLIGCGGTILKLANQRT